MQYAITIDPAGNVVLVGDRVACAFRKTGKVVSMKSAIVTRVFRTGNLTIFDQAGKQRHVWFGDFSKTKEDG